MAEVTITIPEIFKLLSKTNPHKVSSSDNIPAHACIETKCIYNCTHVDSPIPTVLKYRQNPIRMEQADRHMSLLFMRKNKADPKNY